MQIPQTANIDLFFLSDGAPFNISWVRTKNWGANYPPAWYAATNNYEEGMYVYADWSPSSPIPFICEKSGKK